MEGAYVNAAECVSHQPFGSFVMTTTKSLQDQYQKQFDELEVIKGKSNYQCAVDDQYSVDVAPCIHMASIKRKCWADCVCPYYEQRNRALTSDLTALNYDMFFALPEHVKHRDYIICDEASELEEQLVKYFSCTFNVKVLKACGITVAPLEKANYAKLGRWVSSIYLQLRDGAADIKEAMNDYKKRDAKYANMQKKFLFLNRLAMNSATIVDTWTDSEYLVEVDKELITFKPLKVNKLSKYIFDYGTKIILMSATIIDHKNFCKTLGIDDYEYIEIDSPFDPKNAPIYVSNKYKLNYKNLQANLPKVAEMIQQICDNHEGEKGIIHTHTSYITRFLQNELVGDRFLFRELGVNNESILEDHTVSTDPTVLVSPSLTFGVDLKDDLARFQIIVKAPFLPIGEERIKRLMKDDPEWYLNKMLVSLIQSCGRGIRSKTDHCDTYILDGTIGASILRNKSNLPKYFIDRFA